MSEEHFNIVWIDDDFGPRGSIQRGIDFFVVELMARGCEIQKLATADEALGFFREHRADVDGIILDISLPLPMAARYRQAAEALIGSDVTRTAIYLLKAICEVQYGIKRFNKGTVIPIAALTQITDGAVWEELRAMHAKFCTKELLIYRKKEGREAFAKSFLSLVRGAREG